MYKFTVIVLAKPTPQTTTMTTCVETVPHDMLPVFKATKTSKIEKLRSFDPELWPSGSARLIQTPFQPQASLDPVVNENGWLLYRGVYYYSDNKDYPYVALTTTSHRPFPLVRCCNKHSYDLFLSKFFNAGFSNACVSVHLPSHPQ